MRFEDGRWVCSWCGAPLDIPVSKRLVETVTGATPHHRVIMVDGHRVHDCVQPAQPAARKRRSA